MATQRFARMGPAPGGPAHGRCALATPSPARHLARVPPVRVSGFLTATKEPQHAHTEDTPMATETRRLRELTVRYTVKRDDEGRPIRVGRMLTTPRESASVLMPLLQHEPSEVFAVLFLSTRHHVLAYHEVGRGTLDTVLVTPREVFKAAILANAAAVILCHSHPSGDPTPSPDDVALTRRLAAAGTLLGIEVLDHIIVADDAYVSLRERGCL